MKIFVIAFILFLGFAVQAQEYGVLLTGSFGQGEMGDGGAIKARTMRTLEGYIIPGVFIKGTILGPAISYRQTYQITEVKELNNQNLKGRGVLYGIGVAFWVSKVAVYGSYDLGGEYKLAALTPQGVESIYRKPTGFHLGVSARFWRSLGLGIMYSSHSYTANTTGPEADITERPMKESNLALTLGFAWF